MYIQSYTSPHKKISQAESCPGHIQAIKGIANGHTWAPIFSRGGEEYLKICSTPQNGSRGGDTFSLCREGVEGGKGGDKPNFYRRRNLDFYENKSKNQEAFLTK